MRHLDHTDRPRCGQGHLPGRLVARLAAVGLGVGLGPAAAGVATASAAPVEPPIVAADLAVSLAVDHTTAAPGDDVIWTVTIRNDGPDAATDIAVLILLPAELAYGSATSSGDVGCVGTGHELWCTGSTVGAGASTTITVPATVLVAADAGVVAASATLSSAGADPDPSDAAASATLEIVTAAAAGPVPPGPEAPTVGELPTTGSTSPGLVISATVLVLSGAVASLAGRAGRRRSGRQV